MTYKHLAFSGQEPRVIRLVSDMPPTEFVVRPVVRRADAYYQYDELSPIREWNGAEWVVIGHRPWGLRAWFTDRRLLAAHLRQLVSTVVMGQGSRIVTINEASAEYGALRVRRYELH